MREDAVRQACSDLYARYVHAVDQGDWTMLTDCFHPDASYSVVDAYRVEGSDEIVQRVAVRRKPGMTHVVSNILLESRCDGVSGRATFLMIGPDGQPVATGTYDDRMTYSEERGWRFTSRCIAYRWRTGAGQVEQRSKE